MIIVAEECETRLHSLEIKYIILYTFVIRARACVCVGIYTAGNRRRVSGVRGGRRGEIVIIISSRNRNRPFDLSFCENVNFAGVARGTSYDAYVYTYARRYISFL